MCVNSFQFYQNSHKMSLDKHLKSKFFLLLLLSFAISASAQINLPKSHFNFDFPEGGWKYLQTTNIDKNTTIYLYSRTVCVLSKDGDTILPFLRIYVKENVDNFTAMDFALRRFLKQPFDVLEEFTASQFLPTEDAIGYVGQYKDKSNINCQFYMIYFVYKKTLVEFRLETSADTFDKLKEEFEGILNTINLN